MEKNKKIFFILCGIICALLSIYIRKQYTEYSNREGFLPLAIAYTNTAIIYNNVYVILPILIFFFIFIVAGYIAKEMVSTFLSSAHFAMTKRFLG